MQHQSNLAFKSRTRQFVCIENVETFLPYHYLHRLAICCITFNVFWARLTALRKRRTEPSWACASVPVSVPVPWLWYAHWYRQGASTSSSSPSIIIIIIIIISVDINANTLFPSGVVVMVFWLPLLLLLVIIF